MTEAGSDYCKLTLKTTKEDEEEKSEISLEATVTALLSQTDGIFALKVKQITTLKAFLGRKDVFCFCFICFSLLALAREQFNTVTHFVTRHGCMSGVGPGSSNLIGLLSVE